MPRVRSGLTRLTVDELVIDDERSVRGVAVCADLKQVLRKAGYTFRALPAASGRWDRALLLNLTVWDGVGGDVLVDKHIAADVVSHVAWHHLAARVFARPGRRPTSDALFLGEAIASAFDLYLLGRLLVLAPRSPFLRTTVPALSEVAAASGLSARQFEALLAGIAADPDRAFEDLRQLLFDASVALHESRSTDEACAALAALDRHRMAPLLPHYELSNWVLFAHAHGRPARDPRVRRVDQALRRAPSSLDWLAQEWVAPRAAGGRSASATA